MPFNATGSSHRPAIRSRSLAAGLLALALCPIPLAAQDGSLPIEELKVFSEVFGLIKNDYVEPVDDVELLRNAVGGMLSGLDPHSAYLDPESFDEIQIGTEGRFGGLGIEVTLENGLIKVVTPIDDTPAYRAGILPGDIITRLDDTPVKGLSLDEAVKRMRGEPGTSIVLTIIREDRSRPLRVTLERAEIKITSVRTELLDGHFGYARITQFQADTGSMLRRQLRELTESSGNDLRGLVLDLRNNPGGILSGAVSVSDVFLEEGVIVSTRSRDPANDTEYSASPRDYLNGAPIIVLVNSGSASASEIVAGALQDHKRAVILGSKTFGKGSVQTILPLDNGAALKITTARYYTPSGRSIQATGIEPDITSSGIEKSASEGAGETVRESDLAGHLENEASDDPAQQTAVSRLTDDPLVREAIGLLKALDIITSRG